jgi:hypothetical protein
MVPAQGLAEVMGGQVQRVYLEPQEAGRSSGLPVYWPLWPAPLPPLVGRGGIREGRGCHGQE